MDHDVVLPGAAVGHRPADRREIKRFDRRIEQEAKRLIVVKVRKEDEVESLSSPGAG